MEDNEKKKYIVLGIGISIMILIIIILLIIKPKTKATIRIECTPEKVSNVQKWTFDIGKKKIVSTKLELIDDYMNYNYELVDTVSNEVKDEIKTLILQDLGLEKEDTKGIKVSFEFDNNIHVTIEVDYSKADKEKLEYIGLDFEDNIDIDNFTNYVDQYGNGTFTCKKSLIK